MLPRPHAKFHPEAIAEAQTTASAFGFGQSWGRKRHHLESLQIYKSVWILLCHVGVFNVFVYSVYLKRKQKQ